MKTVIITGSTGGLGTDVTGYFLNKGYRVIATVRNMEARKKLPDHPNLLVEQVDLEIEADVTSFVDRIAAEWKTIDGVLLLAGGYKMGDLEHTTAADINDQIHLNFNTAFYLTQALYSRMKIQKHGRMVFMGSQPALHPEKGKAMIAYALSKSLLFRLADMINAESNVTGIKALVLAPGTINTPANRKNMPKADRSKWDLPEDLAEKMEAFVGRPDRYT